MGLDPIRIHFRYTLSALGSRVNVIRHLDLRIVTEPYVIDAQTLKRCFQVRISLILKSLRHERKNPKRRPGFLCAKQEFGVATSFHY